MKNSHTAPLSPIAKKGKHEENSAAFFEDTVMKGNDIIEWLTFMEMKYVTEKKKLLKKCYLENFISIEK